jgi:hypothetical protein
MRNGTNRTVAKTLSATEFFPSQHNLSALRIGSTAASNCIQAFSYGSQVEDRTGELVNPAVDLLENWSHLHPAARHSLIVGTAMLFSCLLVHCDSQTASRYVLRIVSERERLPHDYLGLMLVAFALSRADYPDWAHPPHHRAARAARAERAIEAITRYASELDVSHVRHSSGPVIFNTRRTSSPDTFKNRRGSGLETINTRRSSVLNTLNNGGSRAMIYFGLLELLSNAETYKLVDADFEEIQKAIASLIDADTRHVIHTLPSTFDIRRHTMEIVTRKLSANNDQHDLFANDTFSAATAHLAALHRTYHPEISPPTDQVYTFVIECFCRAPPSEDGFFDTMALDLMHEFPRLDLSESLVRTLNRRNIPSLLVNTLGSEHFVKKLFAARLLCLLIDLTLRNFNTPSTAWEEFLAALLKGVDLAEAPILAQLEQRRNTLATEYENMLENDRRRRHKYFTTLGIALQNGQY